MRLNRVRAGQNVGRLPYEAVPADKQRAAFRFLAEDLFSDEAMAIPKGLLAKLAPDLRETDPEYLPDPALFPYEENVTDVRKWAIESLLSVERLKRMAETRQLADGPAYSVPELFRDLADAVWSETASRKTAAALAISPLRRRAQAALTEHLLRVIRGSSALEDDERGGLREPVNPYSSEAVAAARSELARLSGRIASLLEKARRSKTLKADPAVIGHLENTYQRIQSVLRD
ncbi:MAG: zinc-dependent metalloprotease [Elusimicrobia bacterium]|nr:zinc-dependent metalloprotease [Elusimicrobiota bacterium]